MSETINTPNTHTYYGGSDPAACALCAEEFDQGDHYNNSRDEGNKYNCPSLGLYAVEFGDYWAVLHPDPINGGVVSGELPSGEIAAAFILGAKYFASQDGE